VLDEEELDADIELDVDDNVLDVHIDDEIIENDNNDDVVMANPFNIYFEPDDTYVELDKEEDQ
jgi:hypothetical protein